MNERKDNTVWTVYILVIVTAVEWYVFNQGWL